MIDKLSLEKLKEYTAGNCPVHFFDTIGSTSAAASELACDGACHGTVVYARHQTRGKGRLGRSFASPDDSGIYMSIVLEPDSSNPVLITTAAAVAVCRAIEKICGVQPQIKWVNDIYLNNKKICGILAETVHDPGSGAIGRIILGIGVNCKGDAIPDDLKDIAGAVEGDFSINQLATEIHHQVMLLADDLNPERFIEDYKHRSMVLGKTVTVYKGGFAPGKQGIPAHVLNINDTGGLIVLYSSGQQETLSSGEISIRL